MSGRHFRWESCLVPLAIVLYFVSDQEWRLYLAVGVLFLRNVIRFQHPGPKLLAYYEERLPEDRLPRLPALFRAIRWYSIAAMVLCIPCARLSCTLPWPLHTFGLALGFGLVMLSIDSIIHLALVGRLCLGPP